MATGPTTDGVIRRWLCSCRAGGVRADATGGSNRRGPLGDVAARNVRRRSILYNHEASGTRKNRRARLINESKKGCVKSKVSWRQNM